MAWWTTLDCARPAAQWVYLLAVRIVGLHNCKYKHVGGNSIMNFYQIISKLFNYWGGMDCAGKLPFPKGMTYVTPSASSPDLPWATLALLRTGSEPRTTGRKWLGLPDMLRRFLQEMKSTNLLDLSHYLAVKSPATGSAAPGFFCLSSEGLPLPIINSGWVFSAQMTARLSQIYPSLHYKMFSISLLMSSTGSQVLGWEREGRTYTRRGHAENAWEPLVYNIMGVSWY